MLTSRCYSMIKNIAENRNKIKVIDLANLYGVSSRVIYYDLDSIKDYLGRKTTFKLCIEDGGVCISTQEQVGTGELIEIISRDAKTDIFLTPEERMLELLYKLLNEETIRIAAMAEIFAVSKTTMVKDFDYMKLFFRGEGVKLEATAQGFRLLSDEVRLRISSVNFLLKLFKPNHVIYRMYDDQLLWQTRPYDQFVKRITFWDLARAVRTAIGEEPVSYDIFNLCVLGICIALIRDQHGYKADISENSTALLADTGVCHMARRIYLELQAYTTVNDETGMLNTIAILLLGAQVDYEPILYLNKRIDFKVAAGNFVVDVCNKAGLEVSETLIDNVKNDLFEFLINVDGAGLHKMDNATSQIELEYQELLDIMKGSSYIFANVLGFQMDEQQYAVLTMNFIEQYDAHCRNQLKQPRVLIVCNAGTAASRLIGSRLQSYFDVEVTGITSIYEVQDFVMKHEVDYIITSVPLAVNVIPCIQVNSYLSERDIFSLKKFLPLKKMSNSTIYRITELAQEYGVLENKQGFMEEVAAVLNVNGETEQVYGGLSLYQVTEEACILLDAEYTELSEAVAVSGDMLKDRGYIEEEYIQEIVETVKNSGRYMIIREEMIMPHSLAGKYVKKTGISIIRLKLPLPLYDDPIIKVKWIFTLCTTDKISHITALTQLAQILGNSVLLDEMEATQTNLQLLSLLQRFSAGDVL